MPKAHEMIESKFLKKEDVGGERGVLVTISGLSQANVAMQGAEPDLKWTMSFQEMDKPMVLNSTNINACVKACGSDDTDGWIGKKVVLYEDPNVSFGGKLVGGIRLRAQRIQAAPVVPERKTQPAPVGRFADMDDDIPF
mgnify:CR=1 FL=1